MTAYSASGTSTAFLSSATEDKPTVQDLENQKAENDRKIAELKKEIEEAKKDYDSVVSDESAKLDYQNALNEKIILQNQNIGVVVEEMNRIDEDIKENVAGISDVEEQIGTQNVLIDENMELYKKRLRASYMSGGDNLAAVLSGSSNFEDILMKFEIISRVADHDKKLVTKLNEQLVKLKELEENLQNRQEKLSGDLEDAAAKKEELNEKLEILNADYDATSEELSKLDGEKTALSSHITESEELIALKEEEQKKMDAAIEEALERIKQESIAESKRVSESLAIAAEESRKAEESKKAEESRRAAAEANREKPVTEVPVQQQEPVTQTPDEPEDEPVVPDTTEAPAADNSSLMFWPVPGFTNRSSDFWDGRNHGAIDVDGLGHEGGIRGAKVYAADNATVTVSMDTGCTHEYSCRCGGGYGNYIILTHDDAVHSTVYAHLQAVFVSAGQRVSKGQLIGLVGTTGSSSGPHLHFEVRTNGVKVDPDSFEYQNEY